MIDNKTFVCYTCFKLRWWNKSQ